jgi:ribosomal protein L37AE/L43A
MINVRFACGHGFKIDANVQTPPVCPTCGERRVSRVTAPAPTFRGFCSGPSAETAALAAIPVAIPKET